MKEQLAHEGEATVDLLLEVDRMLFSHLEASAQLYASAREAIEEGLASLMRVLGIPGSSAVSIALLHQSASGDPHWLRLRINGHVCQYADAVILNVESYLWGQLFPLSRTPRQALAWLDELLTQPGATESAQKTIAEFLRLTCHEIITRQPELLLGLPQVETYAASLGRLDDAESPRPWQPAWLLPMLRQVLRLRISIADTATAVKVLHTRREQTPDDIVEHLVDALCPSEIEIRVPEAYLRDLTTTGSESHLSAFSSLRTDMSTELGMVYPDFRFVVDPELKPNSFAFVLNHLPTIPFVALAKDECMVNDSIDRLRWTKVEGRAAFNPAFWFDVTVINTDQKALLDEKVWRTWDQLGQFILTFAETLRKNSAAFVTQRFVEQQLDLVSQPFPALVEAAKSSVSIRQITRVLRSLVAEEVSIRDLHGILERMMDYRYGALDTTRYLVLDDRISTSGFLAERWGDGDSGLAAFVRAGLKHHISYKAAHRTTTLAAYLLDQEIEEVLSARQPRSEELNSERGSDDDMRNQILEAIRTELTNLPPMARVPCILTTNAARPLLHELTRLVFPGLAILSYQDLAPQINVQPVARISVR